LLSKIANLSVRWYAHGTYFVLESRFEDIGEAFNKFLKIGRLGLPNNIPNPNQTYKVSPKLKNTPFL